MLQVLGVDWNGENCRIYGATAEGGQIIGRGSIWASGPHISTAMIEALDVCRLAGHDKCLVMTNYALLVKLWSKPFRLALPETGNGPGVRIVERRKKSGDTYAVVVGSERIPTGNHAQWQVARLLQQFCNGWRFVHVDALPSQMIDIDFRRLDDVEELAP